MTFYKNPQIEEFINDFKLRKPNGVISFNASVEFRMNDLVVNKISEVQIITSTKTETIYFIEDESVSHSLPDMLEVELHEIIYLSREMIILKGNNTDENYSVSIKPVI